MRLSFGVEVDLEGAQEAAVLGFGWG